MNLVTQFLTDRRDRLLMRLGCWLVSFSLVLGLMLPQQRAQAVEPITMTAVASLAAAYLCACGLTFVTQGMDKDALVSNVQRLIQEFLDTELGGITIQDWLDNVWNVAVLAGKLVMGRPLTEEFVSFAQWVAGKYAIQVGANIVYESDDKYPGIVCSSSSGEIAINYPFSLIYNVGNVTNLHITAPFTITVPGNYVIFSPTIKDFPNGSYFYCDRVIIGPSGYTNVRRESDDEGSYFYFTVTEESISNSPPQLSFVFLWAGDSFSVPAGQSFPISLVSYLAYADAVPETLGIDRAPSMSYIPEGIETEQGIALDVGAAATMDLDMVLQGVLDDVLAGELTSTMEAAGEEVVDPPAEELPDVDELGLPALGAALTSRFPFSIPWDFFRAVKLVAAPAKAPRFEVDFMAPIEHRVGQWQGDTTIVLDFSEYAIIGQISRWTSMIGFCLMLAGATKHLIWTA